MKKYLLSILITPLFFTQCRSQINDDQTALKLNNKASILLERYGQNNDSLRVALDYLNRATELSKNYICYTTKAFLQCKLGEPDSAIHTLDICISLNPDLLVPRMSRAMLLEKNGHKEEADPIYKTILNKYTQLAAKYPDSIFIEQNKITLLMFVNGKQAGLDEYEKACKKHPNDKMLIAVRNFYYDFDRIKFVESICE
jgi:tetratricopeptide (TPR) repeat protein